MLNRLPIKREYLFFAGVLLLAWIGYVLAFRKTWKAWQMHQQLSSQIVHATDLQYQPGYLERKDRNLGLLVKQYTADSVTFRNRVISSVAALAEKQHCKITEIPSAQHQEYENKYSHTQKVSIEGNFFALVRLLHALETMPHGQQMVRSVVWHIRTKPGSAPQSERAPVMNIYQVALK